MLTQLSLSLSPAAGNKVQDLDRRCVFVVCKSKERQHLEAGGRRKKKWRKIATQKELAHRITHVCLLNTRLASGKPKAHSTVISAAVWFGMSISLSFPVLPPSFLFSPCVARCAFSSPPWNTGVGEKRKKERTKKGRDSRPPRENLQRALLNKVFKYYPKLKDIHTCLKSSPPLPFSLFLFLSTVAGVGWFPWWPSCTAQPGAPSGFFFFHSGVAEWRLRQDMCNLAHELHD